MAEFHHFHPKISNFSSTHYAAPTSHNQNKPCCPWLSRVPGPNGTSPSWIYDNAPVLSNSARLAPDFEAFCWMRRCLNRWRREMLEEAPPTTTLLMLGQVHLEKWSLGGCGMYWRNDVGRCWEGKNPTMVQRFKVENDAKPSVVFRKLTHFSCLTSV